MATLPRSHFQETYRRIERRSRRRSSGPAFFGLSIVVGIALMFAVVALLTAALRASGHT